MDRNRLIHAVAARAGIHDQVDTWRIVVATVGALLQHLRGRPAALSALLPKDAPIEPGPHPSFEALTAWVQRSLHVREGVAIEWIDATLTELAAALPSELRQELRDELPPEFARAWADPEPSAPPRASGDHGAAPGTLASGVPGAHDSLATGAPHRAHRMSIAESDDPYAGRTLASATRRSNER